MKNIINVGVRPELGGPRAATILGGNKHERHS